MTNNNITKTRIIIATLFTIILVAVIFLVHTYKTGDVEVVTEHLEVENEQYNVVDEQNDIIEDTEQDSIEELETSVEIDVEQNNIIEEINTEDNVSLENNVDNQYTDETVSLENNGDNQYTDETEQNTSDADTIKNEIEFPIRYSDNTSDIEITKEWYENAWCYTAHITFSDYDRLGTTCGNGVYGGTETTSSAAKRMNAIFAVNGCYSAPKLDYAVARDGVIYNDKICWSPGIYNSNTGELLTAWETGGLDGYRGIQLSTLVNQGKVTDTFCFGPPILINGEVKVGNDSSRAQRTFIGTNGNAGDIWIVVSDGRKNDGESSGLTYNQMALYLQSKGCTLGIPLDGGGSSTMVWNGNVLNANKTERKVVDFLYFK